MSIVVSHPTGTANTRALVRGLADTGLLDAFFTSIALPQRLVDHASLPRRIRLELGRRVYDGVPYHLIHTRIAVELLRVVSRRLGWTALIAHETGLASIDRLNAALARRTAVHLERRGSRARVVYAYEDAALETFQAAQERSLTRVLEVPLTEWRTLHRILDEERELVSAWAATLDGLRDSARKLARKDDEIALADHIVVPSAFALRALERRNRSAASIHVVPYGAPQTAGSPPSERKPDQPLKVLFVGQLGQRKGLSYLLEAVAGASAPLELTLIGERPVAACAPLDAALGTHRWVPPIPHAATLDEMQRHHVMVFPSLCEGFGLVILEAMAQGLPVITTNHTGGPDVIEDGVDGFLVPIRDPEAIARRLTLLYEDEPRRRAMADAAKRKASALAWSGYQRTIVALLRRLGEAA